MRILIDTNIFIPLEPSSIADLEPTTGRAARLVQLAALGDVQLLVHPDSLTDIERDRNSGRRNLRRQLFEKYPVLDSEPGLTADLIAVVGEAEPGTNDWVDHKLLAAVQADAVYCLITEDAKLRRKAERLGVGERVITLRDALALLESLTDQPPQPLPHVVLEPAHSISSSDPILDSLRSDYQGFDEWFADIKRDGRRALVIKASDQSCAAVCVLKPDDNEIGHGRSLKLSTLKVSDEHGGNRFGELLLKAVFDYAAKNEFDCVWVTVFEKHQGLLALLEAFGFQDAGRTKLGELVLLKERRRDLRTATLDPFDYHRLYGPPALCLAQAADYIVPIQPQFHRILFPELATDVEQWQTGQQSFELPGGEVAAPFGNAIRKAYMSNSKIRSLSPGNVLYFYRSGDLRGITTVGVVEQTLVSESPDEIALFVGGRTVYSLEQVRQLTRRPVLSILFRQDRHLESPIRIAELETEGAILRAPQSISKIRNEGSEWLREQIQR